MKPGQRALKTGFMHLRAVPATGKVTNKLPHRITVKARKQVPGYCLFPGSCVVWMTCFAGPYMLISWSLETCAYNVVV